MTPPDSLVDALLAKDSWLRREAYRCARDPESADDLVQEAWLAALDRRPSADRSLEPWLQRVLRNRSARLARERARQPIASEDPELGQADVAAEHTLTLRERREQLRGLVEALEEPYRTTLRMRFFEERTVGEIARLATEPRATISSRLKRGLERLRNSLGDRRALPALAFWRRRESGLSAPWALAAVGGGVLAFVLAVRPTSTSVPGGTLDELTTVASAPTEPAASARVGVAPTLAPTPAPTSIEVEATPAAASSARSLAVLDAETGVPRSAYAFELEHPRGARVQRTTDARGRFELPDGWEEHELVATFPFEGPDRALPVRRLFGPAARELRIGRGPVVALRCERFGTLTSAELEELSWSLRRAEPGAFGYPALVSGPGLSPNERYVQLPAQLAHNRAGELALTVATSDGLAGDIVRLSDAALRGEETLTCAWRPLSTIALSLRSPDAELVRHGVAWLRPVDRLSAWPLEPDLADEAGWVQLAALEPGDYELTLDCPPYPVQERAFTLEGGRRDERSIALEPAPESGVVRGRLVSQSTNCREALLAVLESERSPRIVPLVWRDTPDGREALFEIPEVPAGSHQLRLVALQSLRAFDPPVRAVRPGGPTAEFVIRDLDPVEGLDFVAEVDGAPLMEFTLDVRVGESTSYHIVSGPADQLGDRRWLFGTHGFGWSSRTGAALPAVPLGAPVEWTLTSEHGSRSGDRSSFVDGAVLVEFDRLGPGAD